MRYPIATNAHNEAWGEHDPMAAAAAHDPSREPWASMSRDELLEAQSNSKTAAEHDMLQEFIQDKMTSKELETMSHAHALAVFLMREWDASGNDQARFLCEIAGRVAKEIADGMPPMGPPQECNCPPLRQVAYPPRSRTVGPRGPTLLTRWPGGPISDKGGPRNPVGPPLLPRDTIDMGVWFALVQSSDDIMCGAAKNGPSEKRPSVPIGDVA